MHDAAQASCRKRVPRADVLLRAAGHRHAGAELRPAGADRRADRRAAAERRDRTREIAEQMLARAARRCRASSTCTCSRCAHTPDIRVNVDRTLADQVGLTQRDVAQRPADLAVSSSADGAELLAEPEERRSTTASSCRRRSTGSTRSTRWRTRRSCRDRRNGEPDATQLLGNLRDRRARRDADQRHALQHPADVRRADERAGHRPGLASAEQRARRSSTSTRPKLPRGSTITLRGQVESMNAVVHRAWATA